jgi:phosphoesterase RecJ-like protein
MFEVDSVRALGLIARAERLLIVTHVSPDGDAIGSLLGLGRVLQQLGKSDISLACDDGVPAKFNFLPGAAEITRTVSAPYDLVIAVDCSDRRRGGDVFGSVVSTHDGRPPVINIDHHITNTNFGDVNIVLTDTVSTTEVIVRLMKEWEVGLDSEIALCLLTGLVTDTLCFRTANVTPRVMEIAGELMQAGADLSYVTSHTVNRKSYDAIRYWGMLLQTARLDERVVTVHASAEDRRRIGYQANGDASVVSFLVTTWEADVAASFIETDNGRVEISFRAKPGFDVAGLALKLGGGGHPTAAGCTTDGPLEQVVDRVSTLLKDSRHSQVEGL